MHALYVHGMGRSPLSGLGLSWRLNRHGIIPSSFFYVVTFESFLSIERRLRDRIERLASQGDYVLIGHSLGGVLIRGALAALPPETRRPSRVFLLGSPVTPSRIARYLSRYWLFRLATSDCGNLLSSDERMQRIAPSTVPTTSIVGTRGLYGRLSPFGNETNDGVVALSEISASWISEEIRLPVIHTYLPTNRQIADVIIERLSPNQMSDMATS